MLKNLASHAAHFVVEGVLGLLGIMLLTGCVLAWRLSEGPIDITWLVQREQHRLTGDGAQMRIGYAALAWEGFVDPGSALDIRWRDVSVTAADGGTLATLPRGRVTLSASALALGRIVPRVVSVDGAAIAVLRRVDGSVVLDLGQSGAAPAGGPRPASPGGQLLVQDLTDTGPHAAVPFLRQLATIQLRDATVEVRDEALGAAWKANSATIDLQRVAGNGIQGQAVLPLQAGAARATLTIHATLHADGSLVTAALTPISPAALARAVPAFGPAAALDAPVQGAMEAELAPDLSVRRSTLTLQAGPGTLRAGSGSLALRAARLTLALQGKTVRLTDLRIDPQPAPGAHLPPPVVTGGALVTRDAGKVRADFTVDLDRVSFADLPSYWPKGTGGGARPWIVANIPAGTARQGHVTGSLETDDALSRVTVTALAGGIDADDLSLTWLKPVPGLVHARAKLVLQGPDALRIDVPEATQLVPVQGGAPQGTLSITDGSIGITGLMAKDQIAQIALKATGALPDLLALLNAKRLGLLSRRPIAMTDPAGSAAMTLSVRLPLDDRVTFDEVDIHATAHMDQVHLGGVAAGFDLDHGALDLTVDPDTLKLSGTGDVAAIPVTLGVDMDFRNGPPGQVLQHFTAVGVATPGALAASGLPAGVLTGGTAAVRVDYAERRGGAGEVALDMDLGHAAIMTPLGWSKPAGPAASASARLGLMRGRITSIDRLRANGPGLSVASHAQIVAGQGTVLLLDRVVLGRTDAHGSIGLPRRPADPLRVSLRGPSLDISVLLAKRSGQRTEDTTKPTQRWTADLAFDRVILARDETLAPVSLQAESDGVHIARARVLAGAKGEVQAAITPVAGGRTLAVASADAGAVLRTAGIADNIRGGALRVDGFYDDRRPHSPLSGTATLSQFRITDAPAIGRLLKAMTLYGAFDLLRGPGLGFQKAVAPFRYEQQVLRLEDARAFSASLGVTAKGTIDLIAHSADVTGTIVPAYFFNQLPGRLPILGKLFSPEKGGGVFAAGFSVRGKLSDPKVAVNPLAALTPGFLRGIFGLFNSAKK
jgi:hypothetical protein